MNSVMLLWELDVSMIHLHCQVKEGSYPYQAPPKKIVYTLQDPLMEELELLHKQKIIVPLGVDEMSELCISFVLVPKANGRV